MTGGAEWQGRVGRAWADEWRRTDRSFAAFTPHLLAAIAAQAGTRVLDIGCGAGDLSLGVARARPNAQVTGIDISSDLIAAASQRAAETGARHVRFRHADAAEYRDADGAPDLLVSRHGVMFFADPPAVFRHLAAQSAQGAHMVFSCFRGRQHNPWANLFDGVLPAAIAAPADPLGPGPFAFADPDHAQRCLAGWANLTFTPVDFTYVAGAGDDPVADAIGFFARIGPAAARLATVAGDDRAQLLAAMAGVLETHLHHGQIALPASAWIVTAQSDHA
ncbi:class I SAM-dependent methyltransferase [Novosphingobium sp.]|uniref:class I SAM-dependent methyltransferase n=1 Tax=Novosphingobium sp. TaxID=1874826 RepID=UPI00333F3A87